MTAPSARWRSKWATKEQAQRYLNTIKDAGKRQEMADFLGIKLPAPLVFDPASVPPLPAVRFTPVPETYLGSISLSLAYPPSLNSIWRSVILTVKGKPQVRVLLSSEGRAYRRLIGEHVRAAGNPTTPPGARLALHLNVSPPDRRARDLSNIPKALEDALTHAGVWADDSLIDRLIVERGPVVRGGRVDVVILPLSNTLFQELS